MGMEQRTTDELVKILWEYNQLHQRVEKADVIIVLGSHDVRVAERGAQLWLQKYAPLLLFSGGFGRLTDKNWTRPEAEVFAEKAREMGIPNDKILIEHTSTNTQENIEFSKKILDEKDIKIHRVILVHKPYMERRAYATWEKIFPEIQAVITSPEIPFEKYIAHAEISKDETISIIVGDTQRIMLYPAKGFILPQEMPDTVIQAYEELIKRGFTSQLVKE